MWAATAGCQDYSLLALRAQFRCDLIQFYGGDTEVAVGLIKAERRRAGLGGRELEGPPETLQTHIVRNELEAGQPSQVLDMPFPQLRVLGLLADDGARPWRKC